MVDLNTSLRDLPVELKALVLSHIEHVKTRQILALSSTFQEASSLPGALPRTLDFEGVAGDDVADHLVRVLDDDGQAVGPWDPRLPAETLLKMLRYMALTRAFDARMFRAQRQGKTSFYMKSTGEEAVSIGAAMALSRDDMCFPSYRQQGILIARDWSLVDMMNQIYSNKGDRMKGRQLPCAALAVALRRTAGRTG